MARFTTKKSKKINTPPGTLIYEGALKKEKVRIKIIDYNEKEFKEKEARNIEECFSFKDKPTVTWINIDGIHQVEILDKIGSHFSVHLLVLEDILNTTQRPKMEDFSSYIYIVLKMLSLSDKSSEIETEQVSILLGPGFVISFQEREGDVFNPIRDRIRNDKGRIRKAGADYLAYALVDSIIDNYFSILERIGDRIEFMEEELVTNPTPKTLNTIHNLKSDMIFLRKSVWPLREVISGLERSESALIRESTKIYLKDVYDHTIQVIDTVETYRDMVSGMLDIYLSSISNKMNEVMKVLTIIATIFIPLGFIAGLYGMNFNSEISRLNMPELNWPFGYIFAIGIMLLVALGMLAYFRKKRWI